jgi:anti-sigma-K factor RskA
MTSGDIHSLAGAYALDALPADEVADFEAHLAACPTCREDVASFRATAVRLTELAGEEPPPDMRDGVMAMVANVRQEPPAGRTDRAVPDPVPTTPSTGAASGGGHVGTTLAGRLGLGLAAGLLVVAGALGLWAANLDSQLQEREDQAQQVAAVLAAEDARAIRVDGTTLVVTADEQRAVLATSDLAAPGRDQVLQVWVIGPAGPVSAGLIEDPTTPKLLEVPVTAGEVVGVTVEPAGGSPQPTSDPIWVAEV